MDVEKIRIGGNISKIIFRQWSVRGVFLFKTAIPRNLALPVGT